MHVEVGFLFSWTPGDMAELKCPKGSGALRGGCAAPPTPPRLPSSPCPWYGLARGGRRALTILDLWLWGCGG